MASYSINIPVATVGQTTTCLICCIRLPSLETQQAHHRSDWHTYNLKRNMVNLPPVTAEVFSQLVLASREQANPAEVPQPECVPCGKKYLSFQSYDNHLNSKKHKQIAEAYAKKQQQQQTTKDQSTEEGAKSTTETNEPQQQQQQPPQLEPSETVCLFCSHQATDATQNYEHMRTIHGFFLPSMERLIDLPGMLTYLADKLLQNFDCLWCTPSVFANHLRPDQEIHGGFSSLSSVRRHMTDKGHCKLSMDPGAEREYLDFYLSLEDLALNDVDEDGKAAALGVDDSVVDDEDSKRLKMVLLDENGDWILDTQSPINAGIRIDPLTNELVLNNRRLSHKDAVRRQRMESRALTLQRQRSSGPSSSSSSTDQQPADSTEGGKVKGAILPGTDDHHPDVQISTDLLKSQNQLSTSSLALKPDQLNDVSVKTSRAQNYESKKRERAVTKIGLANNYAARGHLDAPYGIKV